MSRKKKKSLVSYIGADLSLFIYIMHMAVRLVLDRFTEFLFPPGSRGYRIYEIIRFLICFAICVVGGIVFNKMKEIVKRKNEVKNV